MKKTLIVAAVAVTTLFSTSCVAVQSPVNGILYTNVEANQSVTSNTLGTKVGRSKFQAILGVANGVASVESAAKSAGIKKVSHVDYKSENILGIFGSYEIIVYGE